MYCVICSICKGFDQSHKPTPTHLEIEAVTSVQRFFLTDALFRNSQSHAFDTHVNSKYRAQLSEWIPSAVMQKPNFLI